MIATCEVGPPASVTKPRTTAGVERCGVRCGERFRYQHRRHGDLAEIWHLDASKPAANPFGDFDNVLGTCSDVGIFDCRKNGFDLLARLMQSNVEPHTLDKRRAHCIGKHRILGHQGLSFEHVGGFVTTPTCEPPRTWLRAVNSLPSTHR